MIITISGFAGSGKTTAAKLLGKKLGCNFYSMGMLRRKMAEERNLTLAQLNELGEKEDFTDKTVDEYQKELGTKEDNFIIDGRLGFHFIPHSLKIFLKATDAIRATRIFKANRDLEKFATIQEALEMISKRENSDKTRYHKYYGVNCFDESQYDIVLDTSDKDPQMVLDSLLEKIKTVTKNI